MNDLDRNDQKTERPRNESGWRIGTLLAKDAKYDFGRMTDLGRAEPGVIEKHGRPVVAVPVEEYERTNQFLPTSRDDRSTEEKNWCQQERQHNHSWS